MSDSSAYKEEQLTVRGHQDADKHWIGETLPSPSLSEITFSGIETATGDSPFPARADHSHDHKTRFCYATNNLQVMAPGSTYLSNFTTINSNSEDWREPFSNQLFTYKVPGTYQLFFSLHITPAASPLAGNYFTFRIDHLNATSNFTLLDQELTQSRTVYRVSATQIAYISSIGPTSNVQFLYTNGSAMNHSVVCYMEMWRRSAPVSAFV